MLQVTKGLLDKFGEKRVIDTRKLASLYASHPIQTKWLTGIGLIV